MMLDFLMNVTIEDVAEKQPAKTVVSKQRNPEGLAIRLFRDGSIYPSKELVERFNLEFTVKVESEGKILPPAGNGFDVIDTQLFPQFNTGKRILIVNVVPKAAAKVDMFGSIAYNEDGTPKASVLVQGVRTFGTDELIPMVEEIYGIKFFVPAVKAKEAVPADAEGKGGSSAVEGRTEVPGVEFVDLQLFANPATGEPWGLPNGKEICYIPKKISRGADKGTITTTRRERPAFYAFLPAAVIEQPVQDTTTETTELPEPLPTVNAAEEVIPVYSTLADARRVGEEALKAEKVAEATESNPFA